MFVLLDDWNGVGARPFSLSAPIFLLLRSWIKDKNSSKNQTHSWSVGATGLVSRVLRRFHLSLVSRRLLGKDEAPKSFVSCWTMSPKSLSARMTCGTAGFSRRPAADAHVRSFIETKKKKLSHHCLYDYSGVRFMPQIPFPHFFFSSSVCLFTSSLRFTAICTQHPRTPAVCLKKPSSIARQTKGTGENKKELYVGGKGLIKGPLERCHTLLHR